RGGGGGDAALGPPAPWSNLASPPGDPPCRATPSGEPPCRATPSGEPPWRAAVAGPGTPAPAPSVGTASIIRMTPRVWPSPTRQLIFTVVSTGRPRRFIACVVI